MNFVSPPVIALLFFAIALLLNLAFVSLFNFSEDSSVGITAALIIGVSLILNHFYKVYKKYEAARLDSIDDIVFQKENFHEFSFKSEFARFREKYRYEIETNDATHFGKELDSLIRRIEKEMLVLARDPKNTMDDFDYHTIVIDQVILALLDEISVGHYIRKGVPDFDTQFFITLCRKILSDEFSDGNLSEEKHDRALKMLEREIQNGKVFVK